MASMKINHPAFNFGAQFPALMYPSKRHHSDPDHPGESGTAGDDLDPEDDDGDSDDMRPATDAIEL